MAETTAEKTARSGYEVYEDAEQGPEVVVLDVVDLGMSLEQLQQEQSPDFVPKTAWKDLDNTKRVKATIGVSVDQSWEYAIKEIEFIWSKLGEKIEEQRPKGIDTLFYLILGESMQCGLPSLQR